MLHHKITKIVVVVAVRCCIKTALYCISLTSDYGRWFTGCHTARAFGFWRLQDLKEVKVMTELYEVTSNPLEEEIGRGAVLALANNYRSFAEAIQELIDNPIDYMRGRPARIDVQISKG